MRFLVAFNLVAAVLATPQGYTTSGSNGHGLTNGMVMNGVDLAGSSIAGELEDTVSVKSVGIVENESEEVNCGPGEVSHVDGSCVEPIVNRKYFLYSAPELPTKELPTPEISPPKVDYNIIFVRTPEEEQGLEPIIVPPPQQKTLVYVLSKSGLVSKKVIEVASGPKHPPEVFYVNYDENENLELAGGVDLQSALASATTREGKIIGTAAGTGITGEAGVPLGTINGEGFAPVAIDERMIIVNGITGDIPFQESTILPPGLNGNGGVDDTTNINGVPLLTLEEIGDGHSSVNSNGVSFSSVNENEGIQANVNGNGAHLPSVKPNEGTELLDTLFENGVHLPVVNGNNNLAVHGNINGNGVPLPDVNINGDVDRHTGGVSANGPGYRVNRAIKQMAKALGANSFSVNSGSLKRQPFYYYLSK